MISIATSNAHKLYKDSVGKKVSMKKFLEKLISELQTEIEEMNSSPSSSSHPSPKPLQIFKRKKTIEGESLRFSCPSKHVPIRKQDTHLNCVVCSQNRTVYFCVYCQVHCCIQKTIPENVEQTCWFKLHNSQSYLT